MSDDLFIAMRRGSSPDSGLLAAFSALSEGLYSIAEERIRSQQTAEPMPSGQRERDLRRARIAGWAKLNQDRVNDVIAIIQQVQKADMV